MSESGHLIQRQTRNREKVCFAGSGNRAVGHHSASVRDEYWSVGSNKRNIHNSPKMVVGKYFCRGQPCLTRALNRLVVIIFITLAFSVIDLRWYSRLKDGLNPVSSVRSVGDPKIQEESNNLTVTDVSVRPMKYNSIPIANVTRSSDADKRTHVHPIVACFIGIEPIHDSRMEILSSDDMLSNRDSSCYFDETLKYKYNGMDDIVQEPNSSAHKKSTKSSKDAATKTKFFGDETCKPADPSYQLYPAARSTCNDVHSLGFDSGLFFNQVDGQPYEGNVSENSPAFMRHPMEYITSGAAKSVWKVVSVNDYQEEELFIMKLNRLSRDFTMRIWDQNRRDALISERAGGYLSPSLTSTANEGENRTHSWSHVLPIYHYCAYTSVVPYSDLGPLDTYIHKFPRNNNGKLIDATDLLRLALQAAKGLYQSHLYLDRKATNAHADVKPSQFLLFSPSQHEKNMSFELPFVQLNDFNRGRYLTRSMHSNKTCPFQICYISHKGSLFRSPEEYMDCADQTDAIDVFSLGGVFFFLLSDGLKPYFDKRSYESAVKKVLKGKLPRLPRIEDYDAEHLTEGWEDSFEQKRTGHPAYQALKEVMLKCWEFHPNKRPTSLEVVIMLQQKLDEVELQLSNLPKL